MHGGRSTGPRTEAGRARIAAAHTIHGQYGAKQRARDRSILSQTRRCRVYCAALQCLDRLPRELAARLGQSPPELQMPPYPATGITAAEDRAMQRAEAEALAPWKQAVALATRAGRAARLPDGASPTHAPRRPGHPPAKPHAPIHGRREPGSPAGWMSTGRANPAQEPHAPERAPIAPAAPAALSPVAAAPPAKPHAPIQARHAPGSLAGRTSSDDANPSQEPHAPERAVITPATPAALPAASTAPAKPHAPIQDRRAPASPAGWMSSDHANPAQEPHAPERAVITPATPAVLPVAATAPARPPAPIQGRHEPGSPAGRMAIDHANPAQEPHAPFHRAASGSPGLTAAIALPPQSAKPHAPARSPAIAETPRLSGRNLRRWRRRQGAKR
jgi:hypothetical protein